MLKRSDMRDYQRHAVTWGKQRRNNVKWIDMGLGKTVIEATTFAELQDEGLANKMLVVAPKRVARKVWSDEIAGWDHLCHLRVSRIVGSAEQCFEALKRPADVYTIGRDRVAWLHAQFVQQGELRVEWPFDVVSLDESQSFNSPESQRTKCMYDLRRKTRFPRMSQLSGTPLPNGYTGLWAPYKLLDDGKRLGDSYTQFRDRFFTPPVGIFTKWMPRPTAAQEIQNLIRGSVLCLREEDYLELPPVVENFVRVELSPAAMRTYKKFEREYIADVGGARLTAVNSGVLDGKLLQLANGACYTGEGRKWVTFHDAKLEALDETLEAIPGRALVAYSFNHDKARVRKVLEDCSARDGKTWRLLDSDRDFQDWAEGRIDTGLLHPASAGHGLNDIYKAGAEDLVFFGLTNNLEWYQQVRARLTGGHRRAGRNVKIHHIVADGTRDDDYVALIKRKALTQDNAKASLAFKMGRA